MFAYLFLAATAQAPQSDFDARETRKLIHSYGECIVNRQQRRAAEAILGNVGAGELRRRYPQLIDGYCMPKQRSGVLKARFQGDQYRYALADALVRKELWNVAVPDFSKVAPLFHREAIEPSRLTPKGKPVKEADFKRAMEGYEKAQAFRFLSLYGECVVRTAPAASRALLLTQPGTPEESAQFTALRPALGECLPEGRTVELGKLSIRGTIAVNYYRLAKAAVGVTAAGEAG